MPTNEAFSGVSNCYVFKSQLQEYAQKVGLPTPVYETIKEGPSHEPSFKSTVIVNDVRYDSLPGFFNRKAAEQSAAEVALMELAKSGDVKECIYQPVHETGLCKNLLQEYAQKMNYAIPVYECRKDETPGRVPLFSCIVEIGGIRYIGAAAKTKKEAEIKAARTALLAIQSSTSEFFDKAGKSQLTVIPFKKRVIESVNISEETANALKPKKTRFKKKMAKRKLPEEYGEKVGIIQVENTGNMEFDNNSHMKSEQDQTVASEVQVVGGLLTLEAMRNPQYERSNTNPSEREISAVEGAYASLLDVYSQNGQSAPSNFNQSDNGIPDAGILSVTYGDLTSLVKMVDKVSGAGEVTSIVNNSAVHQLEATSVMAGLNQSGETIQACAD